MPGSPVKTAPPPLPLFRLLKISLLPHSFWRSISNCGVRVKCVKSRIFRSMYLMVQRKIAVSPVHRHVASPSIYEGPWCVWVCVCVLGTTSLASTCSEKSTPVAAVSSEGIGGVSSCVVSKTSFGTRLPFGVASKWAKAVESALLLERRKSALMVIHLSTERSQNCAPDRDCAVDVGDEVSFGQRCLEERIFIEIIVFDPAPQVDLVRHCRELAGMREWK